MGCGQRVGFRFGLGWVWVWVGLQHTVQLELIIITNHCNQKAVARRAVGSSGRGAESALGADICAHIRVVSGGARDRGAQSVGMRCDAMGREMSAARVVSGMA